MALVNAHAAFVTSDLFNYRTIAAQFGKPEMVKAYLAAPEARYLATGDRIGWAQSGYQKKAVDLSRRVAFGARFVKAMADAGVPLITGGDAPRSEEGRIGEEGVSKCEPREPPGHSKTNKTKKPEQR